MGDGIEVANENARMSDLRKSVIGTALALGCVASLSVGCLTASAAELAKGTSLPSSVRGVPMHDPAKHPLGAAEAYSVSKPFNVRPMITTQAALYAQVQPLADQQTQSTS